jgi:hypothetical protein
VILSLVLSLILPSWQCLSSKDVAAEAVVETAVADTLQAVSLKDKSVIVLDAVSLIAVKVEATASDVKTAEDAVDNLL